MKKLISKIKSVMNHKYFDLLMGAYFIGLAIPILIVSGSYAVLTVWLFCGFLSIVQWFSLQDKGGETK